VVEVELDRVGAGVTEQAGVAHPASGGEGVDAGDHGHRNAGLDRFQVGQVAVRGAGVRRQRREVVERLGEVLGAGLEDRGQLDLLVDDLLFEQGGHDDGARAGVSEARGRVRVAGHWTGGGNDR
jgi:hypothetical protein